MKRKEKSSGQEEKARKRKKKYLKEKNSELKFEYILPYCSHIESKEANGSAELYYANWIDSN